MTPCNSVISEQLRFFTLIENIKFSKVGVLSFVCLAWQGNIFSVLAMLIFPCPEGHKTKFDERSIAANYKRNFPPLGNGTIFTLELTARLWKEKENHFWFWRTSVSTTGDDMSQAIIIIFFGQDKKERYETRPFLSRPWEKKYTRP